ncbi:MAG: EthD family reductase [Alphaproteobacteria bacterium]|nr:EthD family reductase [Alphaproteobacteria bacterium]
MIKNIALLTRREGLSHEDFVKHWRDAPAPLVHAVPGLRRYVQSHIVEERTRPDIPTMDVEIDGIAELWYDDQAAMERANASPEAEALPADGALFIGRIRNLVTEEKVLIPRERA